MIDLNALERHINYISEQLSDLSAEIDRCKRGEYSPLMTFDRFNEIFALAIEEFGMRADHACLCGQVGMTKQHRCSQREGLVKVYMDRQRDKAAA